MTAALDTKVSLSGSEEISGTKTFTTSPLVPSKSEAVGENPMAIATEAQVYRAADDFTKQVVRLTGNQTVDGVKTFVKSPVIPGKTGLPSSSATTNIATEAQVYAAHCWQ
jgi:shikimate kinase